MWAMISKLLLRLAALRWFLKLGGLGLLVPIAFLLKVVGLPILAILSVLALPILLILFVFGLPIFLVLIAGTMLMGFLGMVLSIGVAAVKIGLFVVLPIWLVWKLACWLFRRGGGGTTEKPSSTDVPPVDPTMQPSSESRANPTGDPLSGPISDL
jgi:hypothetical protein